MFFNSKHELELRLPLLLLLEGRRSVVPRILNCWFPIAGFPRLRAPCPRPFLFSRAVHDGFMGRATSPATGANQVFGAGR